MSATRTIRTARNQERFVKALRRHRSVSKACKAIGVGRTAAYDWRQNDESFAAAWDEAWEQNIDDLEACSLRRAIEGDPKPLFYQGKPIVDENGKPVVLREFSDNMQQFMLRANRGEKYHLEKKANAAIPAGVAGVLIAPSDMTPEEWIQAARGEAEARKDGDGEAPSGSGSD